MTTHAPQVSDASGSSDLSDLAGADRPLPPTRRGLVVVVAVVVALMAVVGAVLIGRGTASVSTPGDTSAEAGFARDMQDHHAQAVQLALIVRDRTTDPTIRAIAYDIAVTQTHERGQMFAWLELWHLRQASTQPAMAWMTAAGSGHGHESAMDMPGMTSGAGTASMPGMASNADIARLQELSGKPAEVLFLRLMIAHHKGGVEMAQAVLGLTAQSEVRTLAQRMVTNQQIEITQMQRLLDERNA